MTPQPSLSELERRITALERYNPGVLNERVKNLSDDVKGLKRSFYAFAFSVVAAALIFALTTAFGGGGHP